MNQEPDSLSQQLEEFVALVVENRDQKKKLLLLGRYEAKSGLRRYAVTELELDGSNLVGGMLQGDSTQFPALFFHPDTEAKTREYSAQIQPDLEANEIGEDGPATAAQAFGNVFKDIKEKGSLSDDSLDLLESLTESLDDGQLLESLSKKRKKRQLALLKHSKKRSFKILAGRSSLNPAMLGSSPGLKSLGRQGFPVTFSAQQEMIKNINEPDLDDPNEISFG